jgi:hypothetical protein
MLVELNQLRQQILTIAGVEPARLRLHQHRLPHLEVPLLLSEQDLGLLQHLIEAKVAPAAIHPLCRFVPRSVCSGRHCPDWQVLP